MQVVDGVQVTRLPQGLTTTYREVTANIPRTHQFDFELDDRLPQVKTRIRVPAGSSLRIGMNARYESKDGNTGTTTLPKNFTFILHREGGGGPEQNKIVSPVGAAIHYIFKSPPAGTYYLELRTDGTPNVRLVGTGSAELVD